MYINIYLLFIYPLYPCLKGANHWHTMGKTMRWHMMGSQKVYLEYVQHIYMYIYIYVSCQYIYMYMSYIYIYYVYIANFRPPTVLFVRYHVTSWN